MIDFFVCSFVMYTEEKKIKMDIIIFLILVSFSPSSLPFSREASPMTQGSPLEKDAKKENSPRNQKNPPNKPPHFFICDCTNTTPFNSGLKLDSPFIEVHTHIITFNTKVPTNRAEGFRAFFLVLAVQNLSSSRCSPLNSLVVFLLCPVCPFLFSFLSFYSFSQF